MRIFIISNMFPSEKDALFGVFVRNSKVELEKNGVIFSKESLIRGKSQTTLKKAKAYLKHYRSIWVNFFSYSYDLVYVHYLTHHIPILFLLLKFKKRPLIINFHGTDISGLIKKKWLKFFGKIILDRSDLLVVPTIEFKTMFLHYFPSIEKKKIYVSPSGGIDVEKFYPQSPPKKKDLFTLGFVSRFTREKGWDTFLEALVLLKKNKIPFRGVFAGKGPDENKILKTISRLGLSKQVDFLGFVPQENLRDVYQQLDVYVFPTYRDSLGLTGLEAFGCGIPVIASDIEGGPSTYVTPGKNGYLFAPGNSGNLYKCIHHFYKLNQKSKTELSKNALATAAEYGNKKVASKLKRKLESLL